MGLCEHVYRRGGVYWYRRRASAGQRNVSNKIYLHLSLKVREPGRARLLARLVTVEADRLEGLGVLDAGTKKQLLETFIAEHTQTLDRHALATSQTDHEKGPAAEAALAERIALQRQMGAAYRLLARSGPSTYVTQQDRAELRGAGFSDREIDEIAMRIEFLRPKLVLKEPTSAGLGPSYAWFRGQLENMGVKEPTDENVAEAQRVFLRAASMCFADTDRRFSGRIQDQDWQAYQELVGSRPRTSAPFPFHASEAETQQAQFVDPPSFPVNATMTPTPLPAAAESAIAPQLRPISVVIERMAVAKRGSEWKITKRGVQDACDTEEQYRFLAKVLIRMIGADDLGALQQRHVNDLRILLKRLPTHFGKSKKDWDLPFEETIKNFEAKQKAKAAAEAEAKAQAKAEGQSDPNENNKKKKRQQGRDDGTIIRMLTQLASFIAFVHADIGVVTGIDPTKISALKPRRRAKNSKKRQSIKIEEFTTLFEHATWSGPNVVHTSLDWVPLITRYTGTRREEPCGLCVIEVEWNIDTPSFDFVSNELRELKTEERRVPIHRELMRLGFREYCEAIAALGYTELFPDLPLRGAKTALGDLFDKKFVPVLDKMLPRARAELKTLHAMRTSFATELDRHGVKDAWIKELLGHSPDGTLNEHYRDPANDSEKSQKIELLEAVIKHVEARPIQLSAEVLLAAPNGRRNPNV